MLKSNPKLVYVLPLLGLELLVYSKVQRFKSSKVQRFKGSKVQKFKFYAFNMLKSNPKLVCV